MSVPCPPCFEVELDPRLLGAVVDFTGEVAEVAATLANLGVAEEAGRLIEALDRLDAAGGEQE